MKHLSFRTFLICILLPPALYLITLQGLEIFFHNKWTAQLQKEIISDTRSLMEGKKRIEDYIAGIIGQWLDNSYAIKAGVQAEIFVKTGTNKLIYPQFHHQETGKSGIDVAFDEKKPVSPEDMTRIAQNNQMILQEGIQLLLRVDVLRNSWLANGILTIYIMLFIFSPTGLMF